MASFHENQKLDLDDLSVGMEFSSSEHRIDAGQIVAFGAQYDPQPFHLGEASAQGTFFESLAASGWHTAAITMKLVVHSVPFAQGIIGAGVEVLWPRPTRPGDVLHVLSTITEIKPSQSNPGRATVLLESVTYNQNNDVVQRLVSKLLAFKREQR